MDFFSACLYCIRVREVIQGTRFAKGITTLQVAEDQVLPLLMIDLCWERKRFCRSIK
jgi:hypothetical protein